MREIYLVRYFDYMNRKWHILIDNRNQQIQMITRHFNKDKKCSIKVELEVEYHTEFLQIIMDQCDHLLDELMNGYEVQYRHGFPIFLAGRLR